MKSDVLLISSDIAVIITYDYSYYYNIISHIVNVQSELYWMLVCSSLGTNEWGIQISIYLLNENSFAELYSVIHKDTKVLREMIERVILRKKVYMNVCLGV